MWNVEAFSNALRKRGGSIAACVWAFCFSLVHAYWVAGGAVGLPVRIAQERPRELMLAAAIAIPLLAIAGIGALVGHTLRSRCARAGAEFGMAIVTIFCLAHSVPPLVLAAGETLFEQLRLDENRWYDLVLYEPNWLIGGLLFLKAWRELEPLRAQASRHDQRRRRP